MTRASYFLLRVGGGAAAEDENARRKEENVNEFDGREMKKEEEKYCCDIHNEG